MNDQEQSDRLTEALLETLLEPSTMRQQRIDRALKQFDTSQSPVSPASPMRRSWIGSRRLAMLTTACGLLFAVGLVWALVGTPTAEASLARVIEAARQGVIRTYDLDVSGRRRQTPFQRHMILHSRSTESFAIEMTDAPVQPMVLGIDDQGSWAVTGNQIRRTGDDENPLPMEGFFLNRITMRMLNLNRMLTEIPGNYELRLGRPEPIPGLEDRTTRPVVATLARPSFRLPQSITIWPDKQTGTAMRMEIELPPVRGIRGITAVHKDESPATVDAISPELFTRRLSSQ